MITRFRGILSRHRPVGIPGVHPAFLVSQEGRSRHPYVRTNAMKKTYEAPTLIRLGAFRKKTGFLMRAGNDRLILSKN
ncbi:hypothetical protein GCM10009802_35180 [Streptomyces synnematoformans]|uniref:Uncharacterized protein n=1 Tax=Streptomyces synnematoformans TaxID=415721 RepID=A0ABN2YIW4_9ACTN